MDELTNIQLEKLKKEISEKNVEEFDIGFIERLSPKQKTEYIKLNAYEVCKNYFEKNDDNLYYFILKLADLCGFSKDQLIYYRMQRINNYTINYKLVIVGALDFLSREEIFKLFKSYNLIADNIAYYDDYSKMGNFKITIPANTFGIIIGPIPHKIKAYERGINDIKEYAKTKNIPLKECTDSNGFLKITKNSFEKAFLEILEEKGL